MSKLIHPGEVRLWRLRILWLQLLRILPLHQWVGEPFSSPYSYHLCWLFSKEFLLSFVILFMGRVREHGQLLNFSVGLAKLAVHASRKCKIAGEAFADQWGAAMSTPGGNWNIFAIRLLPLGVAPINSKEAFKLFLIENRNLRQRDGDSYCECLIPGGLGLRSQNTHNAAFSSFFLFLTCQSL